MEDTNNIENFIFTKKINGMIKQLAETNKKIKLNSENVAKQVYNEIKL